MNQEKNFKIKLFFVQSTQVNLIHLKARFQLTQQVNQVHFQNPIPSIKVQFLEDLILVLHYNVLVLFA